MNRSLKRRFTRVPGQQGVELENHFILRLPQTQANNLREVLRSNQSSNIKDRLNIQLDYTQDKDDMRNGIITVDTIMYKSRLVDFPSIVESWKTIDGKNFYKTADICQMLMVKEGDDPAEEEESKKKRRDHPNRVDKKYLFPHGYTPPLKNVRKRRFRKMLRKKILELPEIEKEVKRLLRSDEEAQNVKWEVLREDDEKGAVMGGATELHHHHHRGHDGGNHSDLPANLDEQLFGEMVSSSEDEVAPINILDEDEDSRLSVEDTRFSEPYTQDATNSPQLGRMGSGGLHPHHQFPMSVGSVDHHQQYRGSPSPPHMQSYPSYARPGAFAHQDGAGPSSQSQAQQSYFTEFNPSMFRSSASDSMSYQNHGLDTGVGHTSGMFGEINHGSNNNSSMFGGPSTRGDDPYDAMDDGLEDGSLMHPDDGLGGLDMKDRGGLESQLVMLESQVSELATERSAHQAQMDSLDNAALKSRFLSKLQDIQAAIRDKEGQIRRISAALSS